MQRGLGWQHERLIRWTGERHTAWIIATVDEPELGDLCIGDVVDGSAGDDEEDVAEEEDVLPVAGPAGAYAGPEGADAHEGEGECDAVHGGGDDGPLQPCRLGQEHSRGLVWGVRGHGETLERSSEPWNH